MKHIGKLLFLFLVCHVQLHAQNLLSNPGFETGSANPFQLWVSPVTGYAATMSVSSTNPHAGTKSLLMDVTQSDPSNTNYYDKIWRVQCTQSGFSTIAGQKLLFSFWARADAPHPVQFGITKNSEPYNDFSMEEVDLTTEWKKYEMVFISPVTGNDIRMMFRCGSAEGKYFLDDISLTSQGMSDHSWYAQADTRIEQIRKGDFVLTVKDQNGNILKNCDVTVNLKQHDFKWGTALAFQQNSTEDEVWYRNTASNYFNNAVFENDFKWPSMEYVNGDVTYSNLERYLDWGNDQHIDFRGHTLVWGGKQASPPNSYWLTPSWLWDVSSDSAYKLIERRIKRDLTYFKGRIHEYDVVNEPVHEKALAGWLGDSVHVMAFKWAKQADPTATLYINDYANIDGATTSKYRSYISYLLSKGAPVEGIGVQGHFGSRIDWASVKLRLDYLAEMGLPIKITEFDMNQNTLNLTEAEQASEYSKMMRIAFSHPGVEGFLFWGFWDNRHWIPGAGLFKADKTPKPAADSVYKLIHTTWSTTAHVTTDQNGQVGFRGYYGSYEVLSTCGNALAGQTVFTKNTLSNTVTLDYAVTAVNGRVENRQLLVFPNPATQRVRVTVPYNEPVAHVDYVLINATGQTVSQQLRVPLQTQTDFDIDIQTFNAGIYNLIVNSNGKTYYSTVIKPE
ncbi:endo-1,4-beta-xylanase [Cytophaga hutchinsonii]|uniref:Beta-xylanase n=1 Tax=Cytophaga hutchinsonii (strain ATCC 33406 / DSM 1761 / CIP 103989 / NBRC 15051 / NCIMB 9469 / D465) TaxID=269798 RepID=A0A6N4SSH1_CYTH3|nr:endo-1,4-beta-xylanase [Cytophaga hutchinsonii]ABG59368.1 xylanase; N-terminal CBM4 module, glycoside hydrolase family 10 protein [Cytophaga hutchinsonii ATCC 33406]SFX92458.1 endo-1,4-beta-xylanase [Cytophaga hutchinsonii ATCC 33406]